MIIPKFHCNVDLVILAGLIRTPSSNTTLSASHNTTTLGHGEMGADWWRVLVGVLVPGLILLSAGLICICIYRKCKVWVLKN